MPTSDYARPSARCCWARRGSAHPPTSSVAGGSRWSTSTTGRGPWQRDLRGPVADPSLPVVVVPLSPRGRRAAGTWMGLRRERPGARPHLRSIPLPDQSLSPDWPAFAGIDWGGSEHQLCVLDPVGTRLTQQRLTHDVAGLAALDTALAQHGTAVPIAVERAEGLLVEHLQARGHPVFAGPARTGARAREGDRVAAVKDDRLDAFVLADTLRHEHRHWQALTTPSPLLAEIRALTRDRDRLQQTQQATESVASHERCKRSGVEILSLG